MEEADLVTSCDQPEPHPLGHGLGVSFLPSPNPYESSLAGFGLQEHCAALRTRFELPFGAIQRAISGQSVESSDSIDTCTVPRHCQIWLLREPKMACDEEPISIRELEFLRDLRHSNGDRRRLASVSRLRRRRQQHRLNRFGDPVEMLSERFGG